MMEDLLPKQKEVQALLDKQATEDDIFAQFERAIPIKEHPLFEVFTAAIEQAMYGKGERHGGNVTPFLEQPWAHYFKMHGRGFLTGQAAKKLEAARKAMGMPEPKKVTTKKSGTGTLTHTEY